MNRTVTNGDGEKALSLTPSHDAGSQLFSLSPLGLDRVAMFVAGTARNRQASQRRGPFDGELED